MQTCYLFYKARMKTFYEKFKALILTVELPVRTHSGNRSLNTGRSELEMERLVKEVRQRT